MAISEPIKEVKMKKKTSANQSEIVKLELEKSRFNVSRAVNLLNKTIVLYVVFLTASVLGSIMGYINQRTVSLLVILGIVLLFVGVIPYFRIMMAEENRITRLISKMKRIK